MITKLSKLKELMAAGDYSAALRLAASWPRLGDHRDAITAARAADTNPEFYRSIGRDPGAMVALGIEAIRERYNIE